MIEIRQNIECEREMILGDLTEINQILMNLLHITRFARDIWALERIREEAEVQEIPYRGNTDSIDDESILDPGVGRIEVVGDEILCEADWRENRSKDIQQPVASIVVRSGQVNVNRRGVKEISHLRRG